ncbi:DUF6207 family protein [Streptomyces atratus]|uniref:DUF6207 family protein n=1 Tax=Streptomyces atratus TaxID=1893 RepID=UPI00367767C8
MKIDEQHVAEPGLVALDITAADEDTVRTVMDGLQQQWATAGITPVWRTPGEVGVKARTYAASRTRPTRPRVESGSRTVNDHGSWVGEISRTSSGQRWSRCCRGGRRRGGRPSGLGGS